MLWPPDYREVSFARLNMMEKAIGNPDLQAMALAHYAANAREWIEDWAVTFDPRNKPPLPRLMPFKLFTRQVELLECVLECVNDQEGLLVEKTRDMGATWLCCAISVWLWRFQPGTVIGWGSRKMEYVDKPGDPKAIFPKIRQIIQNLPAWQLPRGFVWRAHSTHMKIINPENDCAITGESGDNIGRGGRTTLYFKDESAHYERPELIEAALGDNTNVQIDISSVKGTGTPFHRRRMAGQVWYPNTKIESGITRVFILDWRDHPAKTPEWYDKRRAKAKREGLEHIHAQEIDRDYAGSVVGIIIKSHWIDACVDADIALGFGEDGENITAADVADGEEGGDQNAVASRRGVILRYIDGYGGEPDEHATRSIEVCLEQKSHELYYDSIGVGSGFKVAIKKMKQDGLLPSGIRVMKWMASAAPLDPLDPIIPGDDQSPTNEQQYLNIKAQAWFRMRARVYKTYRAVVHKDVYDPAELCSFDSKMEKLSELKTELSQATKKTAKNGKTFVDKKPPGTRSPNLADACVMCYNPTRELSIFDVL